MLKAINPNATKRVVIDEVEFEIGILPYGKRVEIESSAFFNKDAKTREQVLALMQQNYQFVQWGIKNHTGLKFEDGTVVGFDSKKEKFGELEYSIVSEQTMNIYAASGLLAKLNEEVSKFNYKNLETTKN